MSPHHFHFTFWWNVPCFTYIHLIYSLCLFISLLHYTLSIGLFVLCNNFHLNIFWNWNMIEIQLKKLFYIALYSETTDNWKKLDRHWYILIYMLCIYTNILEPLHVWMYSLQPPNKLIIAFNWSGSLPASIPCPAFASLDHLRWDLLAVTGQAKPTHQVYETGGGIEAQAKLTGRVVEREGMVEVVKTLT